MRKIKEIIIHCSATREGRDYTVADIDRWHRERGFFCIGYHFVIYRDGSIHVGRSVEEVGAHCKGHNTVSIGVLFINDSMAQSERLIKLNQIAIQQMRILEDTGGRNLLK